MSLTAANANDIMRRAILRIDDDVLLGSLDQLNFKATTKVSAVVGIPLRSLQQKRDVATFAATAPIAAVRALLELIAVGPLGTVVDALGDHAESPSFEQLNDAVDKVLADGTNENEVVAVLAFAVGEEFPAAPQCRRLLDERPVFNLPSLPEISSSPTLLVPKEADEVVREQRRRRREEERLKKKALSPAHATRPNRVKREPKSERPAKVPAVAPAVLEIVRRRFIFTPSELEMFDPNHPLVGSVVLAEVPFDAVDPLIPEQRSKVRPVLVVAACESAMLILGIYSNQSSSRGLFQPWRRLGLAHVSYISADRVALSASPESVEKIGRLSDEEWNSLF